MVQNEEAIMLEVLAGVAVVAAVVAAVPAVVAVGLAIVVSTVFVVVLEAVGVDVPDLVGAAEQVVLVTFPGKVSTTTCASSTMRSRRA